jgi:hypothetical protein
MRDRKYTWKSELRKLIERKWKPGECFTFADVYRFEPHFKSLYPTNLHIQAKLYEIMQHLRDDGVVEFVDNHGAYRKLSP